MGCYRQLSAFEDIRTNLRVAENSTRTAASSLRQRADTLLGMLLELSQKTPIAETMERLDLLGFYRFDDPLVAQNAKARAVSNGWFFFEPTIRGPYHADAEGLTEGDVLDLLRRVKPFLETQGVLLERLDQDFTVGGSYSVTVNGVEFLLYTEDELDVEDIWALTTQRVLRILNTLLEQYQSDERAYILYGGNDTHIVFLTPPMQELISKTAGVPASEKPVDATSP